MEIWLDTIERDTIEQAKDRGLIYGVTTNPAILAQASGPVEEVLEEILNLYSGPLAVQVTASEAAEMIEQGKDLYDFTSRAVIKVPVTIPGLEAIHKLSSLEIPVMATTIFTPMQALLAAQAGASYVAPYFSHLGEEALPICLAISHMHLPAKLLIASLQTVEQMVQCATAGFEAVTLKAQLFRDCLATPPQTAEHLRRFEAAWSTAPPSQLLPALQLLR